MYDIFTYIYHKSRPNVGECTSPMDPMGHGLPVCFLRGYVLPVLTCWGSRHWEQHLGSEKVGKLESFTPNNKYQAALETPGYK